jgi:hypothetical protein
MYSRFKDDGMTRGERPGASRIDPVRHESRSERVLEIRRRVADDAYRSEAVVDEIARRILRSREL